MARFLVKHTLHLERRYVPGEFLPEGVPGRTVDRLVSLKWVEPYHTLDELQEQERISVALAAEVELESSTSTRHRKGRPGVRAK